MSAAANARAAFERAAEIAHAAGRKVAITLSDTFVVARWRAELLAFIEASADIVLANEGELAAHGLRVLLEHRPVAAETEGDAGE